MLYDISLKITYDYEVPVSGGRHLVRVLPATLPGRQRLVVGSLSCHPVPAERTESIDFFANPFTSILFRNSHADLTIRMQARVQVEAQALTADFSPDLAGLPAELAACWSVDAEAPHHFAGPSPLLPEAAEIAGEFVRHAMVSTRNQPHFEDRGVSFELNLGELTDLVK